MDIKIGKYQLTSDNSNYILQHKIKNGYHRDGTPRIENVIDGYFTSIEDLLKGFVELRIKNSDARTFKELAKTILETKKVISDIQAEFYLGITQNNNQ